MRWRGRGGGECLERGEVTGEKRKKLLRDEQEEEGKLK